MLPYYIRLHFDLVYKGITLRDVSTLYPVQRFGYILLTLVNVVYTWKDTHNASLYITLMCLHR